MDKKHPITCNVSSCKYNENRGCNVQTVEVCLNNSVIASTHHETACHTFQLKQLI